jgi:hypothetical protein
MSEKELQKRAKQRRKAEGMEQMETKQGGLSAAHLSTLGGLSADSAMMRRGVSDVTSSADVSEAEEADVASSTTSTDLSLASELTVSGTVVSRLDDPAVQAQVEEQLQQLVSALQSKEFALLLIAAFDVMLLTCFLFAQRTDKKTNMAFDATHDERTCLRGFSHRLAG